MVEDQQPKFKNLSVLGNNYDGCLLTGDTVDIKEFTENNLEKLQNFKEEFMNAKAICLGLKNAAIINCKIKITFI
jgi:hypothetical protein